MKIYIPNTSKQSIGGGWTFLANFKKGCAGKAEFVSTWQEADVVLITGATMTNRDEMNEAKAAGKKIVFRLDNMPKDSRNRGTAFSRVRDFAKLADTLVFQSEWAKMYVGDWLRDNFKVNVENAHVIYNGVDTSVFNFADDPNKRPERYIFVHYNRDENKRFPEAAYDFHMRSKQCRREGKPLPELILVGQFSPELLQYNFDFFDNEKVTYVPPTEDRNTLAELYRGARYLYFPAFADAAPNTVLEAMACGCDPLLLNRIGGSYEVADRVQHHGVISIEEMADNYLSIMK